MATANPLVPPLLPPGGSGASSPEGSPKSDASDFDPQTLVGSPPKPFEDYYSDEGGNRVPLRDSSLTTPRYAGSAGAWNIRAPGAEPRIHTGMLRRLSLSSNSLMHFAQWAQRNAGSQRAYNEVIYRLLGRGPDEFLGHGLFSTPGYDNLGQFPVFEDSIGRFYYDAAPLLPDRVSTGWTFVVQIPRHITRAQGVPGRQPSFNATIQFPQPDELLILRPCRVPFFPFAFDAKTHSIDTSADPHNRTVVLAGSPRLIRLAVRVHSRDNERRATCLVSMEPDDPESFQKVYGNVQMLRELYYEAVQRFFTDAIAHEYEPTLVLEFIHYLKHDWLPALRKVWKSRDQAAASSAFAAAAQSSSGGGKIV